MPQTWDRKCASIRDCRLACRVYPGRAFVSPLRYHDGNGGRSEAPGGSSLPASDAKMADVGLGTIPSGTRDGE